MGTTIGIGIAVSQGGSFGTSGKGIVLYDDFNRADNVALGTATTGQTWTTTTYGISSNQVYKSSGTAPVATIPSGVSDGFVQFQETALTEAGVFQGILFRYTDTNNFLRLVLQDGILILQKRDTGVTTTVASTGITRTVNNIYKVQYSGSTIMAYVNGVRFINTTSTFNTSATSVGFIGSNSTTGRMDNFFVGAI